MATLKSVLHHFNKALKEYDTLHPETEVAQIVDLLPTINAAINGSSVTWDEKKFTNNELGITGLIDTNGYVAFGPNFGGLIIQWGTVFMESDKQSTAFTYPITFPKGLISAAAADTGGGAQGFGVSPIDNQHANIFRSGKGYAGCGRLIIIGS